MKSSIAIFCLILSFKVSQCQTPEKELSNLIKGFIIEKTTPEQQQTRSKEWRDLITKVGYPKLPYDSVTDRIVFNAVFDFPGVNKTTISNRILEWSAMEFGSLDAVLHYRNDESGKIILKGFTNIAYSDGYKNLWGQDKQRFNRAKCSMVIVFTIKDGKMKAEFSGIEYTFSYTDFTTGLSSSSTYPINEIYPVTKFKPSQWDLYLSLLGVTNKFFIDFKRDLSVYVKDATKDYEF